MRILIVGHDCNPYAGSEGGLTWNWAYFGAERNEVHLLAHPQHRKAVERFLLLKPCPNLMVHWIEVPRCIGVWKPDHGDRRIRLHYILWLHQAFKRARCLHATYQFDLVHHVGWGTVSAPSPFWRLDVPLLWGPLGGGQTTPTKLLNLFGRAQWKEILRTVRIKALPFWPSFRRSVKRSAFVFATNRETARLLEAAGAREVYLLMDNGLQPDYIPEKCPTRHASRRLNVLWASRLIPLKGLDLALLAIKEMGSNSRINLTVVGTGPQSHELSGKVKSLGIAEQVTVKGHIAWPAMPNEFLTADVFLFTSVRDSCGTVVLEAAAFGLPILTLDLGGIGTFLPEAVAVKIPPSDATATVQNIVASLESLRDHPERRLAMAQAAHAFAKRCVWNQRAEAMHYNYLKIARNSNVYRPSADAA